MAIAAKNIGTNSELFYYATTGTTEFGTLISSGSKLGGVQSITWSVNNNMVDSTNNDDGGYTSALYGNQSASLSVDCVYDPTDTAQGALIAAAFAKTKVCMGYAPIYTNNEDAYVFDALVEAAEVPSANDETITISFTFTSDGTITRDTSWTAA